MKTRAWFLGSAIRSADSLVRESPYEQFADKAVRAPLKNGRTVPWQPETSIAKPIHTVLNSSGPWRRTRQGARASWLARTLALPKGHL